jgi:hypothetical protein
VNVKTFGAALFLLKKFIRMERVLITGGSGLIGRHLTALLQKEGYEVGWLTRSNTAVSGVQAFTWNAEKKFIHPGAFSETDHVIHLAGTSVAWLWTSGYKRKILASRIDTARLIFDQMKRVPNKVKTFISASGIGYYGDGGERWLDEDAPAGNDFLAKVCVKWEEAANQFEQLGKRVAIFRTGIVMAREGGTLPPLMLSMKFGIAPVFGKGKQFYSWIHIDDLCSMYLNAIRNETISGVYNAVAPNPVPFRELIDQVVLARKKRYIRFAVPKFLLKLTLGGFGETLLGSQRCRPEKIRDRGFLWKYADLRPALENLLMK